MPAPSSVYCRRFGGFSASHPHASNPLQLLADLRDAEAAAAEHLAELRGRVAAKQEGIQQQQAALRKKVTDHPCVKDMSSSSSCMILS